MKIPSKIKIGGYWIDVKVVTFKETEHAGIYDGNNNLIQINKDIGNEGTQAETFLHEILEAINYMGELKLEHKVLNDISQWVFMTIRDNDLDFRGKK